MNKLAGALKSQGLKRGEKVGFLVPNIPEMLEGHFAPLKIGAVLVAINIRLSGREISYILNHSEAKILVFDSEYGDNWTTEQLNYSTINVIDHTFYHEMGHALIDIYELPITGPEERVADQFGAFMVLGFLEQEIAHDIMMDTAIDFWLAAEENPDLTESAFADTHGLNKQRFYDLACWAYGSDPDYHQYMWSSEDWIPEIRLYWCELEYVTTMYAWDILLAPFFKDFSPEFLYNYEDWFYQYMQTQQSQTQLESGPESSAQKGMVAQESMPKVPDWVRNIFIWYGEEKISEDELLNAIKFLVSQGIIKVSP